MTSSNEQFSAGQSALPSFSIIMETENLAATSIDGLILALESIDRQDLPVTEATEALLLTSGDVPAQVLEEIQRRFAWLRFVQLDRNVTYYESKMQGLSMATVDVVVFADSDCIYEPTWLRALVELFSSDDIDIVAGETMISGNGPYSLANHLAFYFDGFSKSATPHKTNTYYANNFACRRRLLERCPIPRSEYLSRGNCALHRIALKAKGIEIWSQPAARAFHAPPLPTEFIWRYLVVGRDRAMLTREIREQGITLPKRSMVDKIGRRLSCLTHHRPDRVVWLPLAIPVAIVAILLITLGAWVTSTRTGVFTRFQYSLEQKARET